MKNLDLIPASVHGTQAWVAQHHAQLRGHVAQCGQRHLWLTAAQYLDGAHQQLGRRFATTVFAAAGLMLLLA